MYMYTACMSKRKREDSDELGKLKANTAQKTVKPKKKKGRPTTLVRAAKSRATRLLSARFVSMFTNNSSASDSAADMDADKH